MERRIPTFCSADERKTVCNICGRSGRKATLSIFELRFELMGDDVRRQNDRALQGTFSVRPHEAESRKEMLGRRAQGWECWVEKEDEGRRRSGEQAALRNG